MSHIRSEDIYSAAFDNEAFSALAGIAADVGGGRSAMIQWRHVDDANALFSANYFDNAWLTRYQAFAHDDVWRREATKPAHLGKVILLSRHVSSEDFVRTKIYNGLVREMGDDTGQCMGTSFATPHGIGLIGIHKAISATAFTDDDSARFNDQLGHFRIALAVRGQLASAHRSNALANSVVDVLGIAIIVVSSDGHVLQINAEAETVLSRNGSFCARRGRLTFAFRASENQLAEAMWLATAKAGPSASSFRAEGRDGENYLVTVTPMPVHGSSGRALVMFRDPVRRLNGNVEDQLQSLFNLTAAEAAIAVSILNGLNSQTILRERSVSANTLKSQMRSLLAKMGCSNRAQVAAVLAGVAPLA